MQEDPQEALRQAQEEIADLVEERKALEAEIAKRDKIEPSVAQSLEQSSSSWQRPSEVQALED